MAGVPIAIDLVRIDALLDQLQTFTRPVEQPPGIGRTEKAFELGFSTAETEDYLATVATRGAPADALCFKDDDPVAGLGQFQCAVQAGVAGAEHAYIGTPFAAQWFIWRVGGHGGGVPGGWIAGPHA